MLTTVLFLTLCSSCYYLGARAEITRWLWSHYAPWLDRLTMCASCSAFWYALGWSAVGWQLEFAPFGLDPQHWATPVLSALSAMVWAPVISYFHLTALDTLGGDANGESEPPGPAVDDSGRDRAA